MLTWAANTEFLKLAQRSGFELVHSTDAPVPPPHQIDQLDSGNRFARWNNETVLLLTNTTEILDRSWQVWTLDAFLAANSRHIEVAAMGMESHLVPSPVLPIPPAAPSEVTIRTAPPEKTMGPGWNQPSLF